MRSRTTLVGFIASGVVLLSAVPASALECFNVSKNEHQPLAGAQIVFDAETENVLWATKGLQNRIDRGLVDLATGEGFHGIIGAIDDDGMATSTYVATPDGHLPDTAMDNGPPDHGIVHVCDAFDC